MSVTGAFGNDRSADLCRMIRAMTTNVLARVAPATYVRLTRETGRGLAPEEPAEVAAYFHGCIEEFAARLDAAPVPMDWWRGKTVVEYGPGDTPGVALLLIGLGAAAVYCVDRFPLLRFSEAQQRTILELHKLLPEGAARQRFMACFKVPGDVSSAWPADPSITWCAIRGCSANPCRLTLSSPVPCWNT